MLLSLKFNGVTRSAVNFILIIFCLVILHILAIPNYILLYYNYVNFTHMQEIDILFKNFKNNKKMKLTDELHTRSSQNQKPGEIPRILVFHPKTTQRLKNGSSKKLTKIHFP